MIGIISALSIEAELLITSSETPDEVREISGIQFHKITLAGKSAVVAVCGVGKVNAARTAQAMIMAFSPEIIINTGVAGSLSENLRIGDLVISENVVQHDMDTSALGDEPGFLSNPPLIFIPADNSTAEKLMENAGKAGITATLGTIASGDQFVCAADKKDYIKKQFGALCCEMEGGAVGQVCYLSGVPFVIVRAISDGSNDDSAMDYPTFAKMAADKSASLIKTLF